MTVSFHHHFREGDAVLNMVMAEIAAMGIKNLTLASSSIANVHEPIIEHIKNGVITNITSSGLRDKVGAAISHGIMENPVVIRSHGGRARAIETGDIHIDVAFLGAPSADCYGNSNGSHGNATCGSLGYAKLDAEFADKVVIVTDNLVPYPNTPISIPQNHVDYVIQVDSIGDPNGIAHRRFFYSYISKCFRRKHDLIFIFGISACLFIQVLETLFIPACIIYPI